jgi:REP element-mobilizing transposase RayT
MPFINLLIHSVWATKDRKPLLSPENKKAICEHIRQNAVAKNIHLLNINGHKDHLHVLFSLSSDQNIATVMNLIKGESSFWANRNLHFDEKFGWQDEYFAVSISKSHFYKVNQYIDQQEAHHQKKTFQDEYNEFIEKYEFENLIKG